LASKQTNKSKLQMDFPFKEKGFFSNFILYDFIYMNIPQLINIYYFKILI